MPIRFVYVTDRDITRGMTLMFEYEKKPQRRLEEYSLTKMNEICIPAHIWTELTDNYTQEELTDHLSNIISTLPFPYAKYTPQDVKRDWLDIKHDVLNPIESEWGLPRVSVKSTTYQGRHLYFAPNNKGLKVSNQFVEPTRCEAGHIQYPSPIRQWTREGMSSKRSFLRPLWTLMKPTQGVDSRVLLSCIALSGYVASQFKPALAKGLYDFFGAKRVLDFSAGWGDRLVGFLASGAESYVGIDPNTKLHEPYQRIVDYCETDKSTRFIRSPAEDADLSGLKVDFVFTSPPYFDTERYSEEPTQSWKRYKRLDDWLNIFLFPVLRKSWDCLEDGGRIAINISDKVKGDVKICQPMLDYMESLGATYEGVIGYRMSKRPGSNFSTLDELSNMEIFCEPIFIWSKGVAPEPKWMPDNFFGV